MQIVLFLIFILLILLVVVSKKNSFTKLQKIIVTIVITLFVVAIYIYESGRDADAQDNREVVNAFRQGDTVICGEHKVNNKRFIYISGTQIFMPKRDQEDLKGVIIKVSTCKVD